MELLPHVLETHCFNADALVPTVCIKNLSEYRGSGAYTRPFFVSMLALFVGQRVFVGCFESINGGGGRGV